LACQLLRPFEILWTCQSLQLESTRLVGGWIHLEMTIEQVINSNNSGELYERDGQDFLRVSRMRSRPFRIRIRAASIRIKPVFFVYSEFVSIVLVLVSARCSGGTLIHTRRLFNLPEFSSVECAKMKAQVLLRAENLKDP
jgi:hypothetical protein